MEEHHSVWNKSHVCMPVEHAKSQSKLWSRWGGVSLTMPYGLVSFEVALNFSLLLHFLYLSHQKDFVLQSHKSSGNRISVPLPDALLASLELLLGLVGEFLRNNLEKVHFSLTLADSGFGKMPKSMAPLCLRKGIGSPWGHRDDTNVHKELNGSTFS